MCFLIKRKRRKNITITKTNNCLNKTVSNISHMHNPRHIVLKTELKSKNIQWFTITSNIYLKELWQP